MLNNYKTWENSGRADCFSCVLTMPDGIKWFIYGSRLPYENLFTVSVSHYEYESFPPVTLCVKGKIQLDCLVRCSSVIQRWNSLVKGN